MAIGRNVPSNRSVLSRFGGESARSILKDAQFARGREVFALSGGDFSVVDWIDALLDYTGPADGVVATWTAAEADMRKIEEWLGACRLSSCRWIVDRSFPNRQPAICDAFRRRFGDDSIRVFRSHAKFVMLSNSAGWKIVALTSANLNHNPRIENFHAADDPTLFDQFASMVRTVFEAQGPGEGFESDGEKMKPNIALKAEGIKERAVREGVGVLSGVPLS